MNPSSLIGHHSVGSRSLVYRELRVSCLGNQLDLLRRLYPIRVILKHFQKLYDLKYPDALQWIGRGLES